MFFTFLATGDHVVVSDTTYEATFKLWTELMPRKYGIEASFVDATDLDAVVAAVRPTTRMLVTEAIANPTTKVADIGALAEIAHRADALLMVDSTFTPPPLYRPLTDGADLVVHSLTKYINGHGDAMGGAVIGAQHLIARIKSEAMVDVGGVISPFNAWLIDRGPSPCRCGCVSIRRPHSDSPNSSPAIRESRTWPIRGWPPIHNTTSPHGNSAGAGSAQ